MHRPPLTVRAPAVGRTVRRRLHAPVQASATANRRLLACRSGSVAVEFALVGTVLIMLMLGSVELGRLVFVHQKMDRVATTISDLVSRAETINESQLADIFAAAGEVASPFDMAASGLVIVSSVTNMDGNGPIVAWQRSGAGSYSGTSKVGTEGGDAVLTGDFQVNEGETAIISEVYFDFAPILGDLIVEPQVIYNSSYHRPRLSTLEEIEQG